MYKKFFWLMILPGIILVSCKKDFSRQPAVSTGAFDRALATAQGILVDAGTREISDHGFCWDNSGEPNLYTQTLHLGPITRVGNFQSQLTTLSPNTFYHLRAFIVVDNEPVFGSTVLFTTPDLPTVVTDSVSDITANFAVCGGTTSENGSLVLERGVCWAQYPTVDTTWPHTHDGTGSGPYTSVLSGLSANTDYFVRAYATCIYGIRYGSTVGFQTIQGAAAPFLFTTQVTNITQTGASSGGNVVSDGGAPVTLRGVCWSTVPYPSTDDNKTENGSGTGTFSSTLTGLQVSTTYYVRAYAINEIGASYGNEVFFTTEKPLEPPTVITSPVTNITQASAQSGGTVTAQSGVTVTQRGVCWNTSPNPTLSNVHTHNGTGVGSFTSSITGLTNGTQYYVRAYASSNVGTAYGNEISFMAGQSSTTPTVLTDTLSNIAQSTATCGGNITTTGGAAVSARGVCWSTSANPTTANSHTTDGSGMGTFISNITGLNTNTQYYVRAYATNLVGTSYGNERVFITLAEVTIPSVSSAPVSNITTNSATSGGTVTTDGGAAVTARGVCWSTAPNPTTSQPHTSDGTGIGNFVSQVTGLTLNTQYYLRAYATNSAGTAYGNQQTFFTLSNPILPILTTSSVTDITQITATCGGMIYSDGGSPVTERGVCWSTSQNPTTGDPHTLDGTGTGSFASYLTGISPNTTYYVRAYATNSVGTAYGNQEVFNTLPPITIPTVTTDPVTDITQTTATSGGNVTSAGGGTVSARGVCWSTAPNPTIVNNHTSSGTGTGTFVSNLIGLVSGTLYYVRAYATNSAGTAYGNEVTFTTAAGVPTVTTSTVSGIGQTTATTGGEVTDGGGSFVFSRESVTTRRLSRHCRTVILPTDRDWEYL